MPGALVGEYTAFQEKMLESISVKNKMQPHRF